LATTFAVNASATASCTYTRSTPTQVCPALDIPPHTAASAAAARSASASTSRGSLPPHSTSTGVSVSAQAAITRLAVAVEPVNAIMPTPGARQSAAPVSPNPVTTCSTGRPSTISASASASAIPTPGVSSLGLKTTALPAASAYAIDPIGVKAG
jgi:hypothetical protein